MIFFHKPYYNPNYTNPNKKTILVMYALNLKNYTKYTNYIMQKIIIFKNIGRKFFTNLKLLNYKDLLIEKKL
jgi:hypothetical protein